MSGLSGKVVVITGGSGGIGAGCGLEFAKHGAKLVLTGRNQQRLDAVSKQCLDQGAPEVLPVIADLTRDEDIKRVVTSTLDKFGTIHVLVNNAGGILPTSLSIQPLTQDKDYVEDMDYSYKVFVRANWQLCGLFVDHLIQNKGCIINNSSIHGITAVPSGHSYGIMKAAVNYMTRCMATELGMKGVRVNAVLPGYTIETGIMTDVGYTNEQSDAAYAVAASLSNVLGQKPMVPSDIAKSIVFLASDQASRITGVLLPVDCGALLASPAYDFTGGQGHSGPSLQDVIEVKKPDTV